MPIQLDKILGDIASEKVLHPNYQGATKKEIDDAWARVGKNSNLSVHESRSIFKVLQKKYEQEKLKDSSAWKLFALMDQIHKKVETKAEIKEDEPNVPIEEDEEYEMLEVQEEEDNRQQHHSGESASESESPSQSHIAKVSPEKEDKPVTKAITRQHTTPSSNASKGDNKTPSTKLLNTLAGNTSKNNSSMLTPQTASATAAALQKKGITMKKTTGNQQSRSIINQNFKNQQGKLSVRAAAAAVATNAGTMHGLEVGKAIQLPETLKRKLSEDQPATPTPKKANHQSTQQSSTNASPTAKSTSPQRQQHTTTAQLMQLKQERNDQQQSVAIASNNPGINLITIPANPSATGLVNGLISTGGGGGGPSSSTAATVASTTSTNGFSPRIEEIDFRNDIIFDSNNGVSGGALTGKVANTSEIINLGNFDNSLPPTFFKNLCNSSRHEALGLYVANVMNRLRPRSAAKLEVGILRAILDIQSEELDQ